LGSTGYVFFVDSTTGVASHAPYFFLDIEQVGGMVAVYILALCVVFILIALLCCKLDAKATKPKVEK
jgi:hypothetical protein